jgi:hypothetical protein
MHLMKGQNVWFVPTYSAMVDISDGGGDYDDPGLQIRGRFVEAGLSPLAAIQAATISGAELLGVSARAGSVEPNMEADLIAVDGNPLERIWIVQNPLLVISNGQIALNALDPSK